MADAKPSTATSTSPGTSGSLASTDAATRPSALESEYGKTTIADQVVSKIAGIATREVNGVYGIGGGATRAIGALRERIPGSRVNLSQGVQVEVGETQAALDIEIVTEYGVSIGDLTAGIRRNVISAVERMTGLQVTEVNINVSDVHVPEDDDDEDQQDTRQIAVDPDRESRVK